MFIDVHIFPSMETKNPNTPWYELCCRKRKEEEERKRKKYEEWRRKNLGDC
jgi:hypothetical protein